MRILFCFLFVFSTLHSEERVQLFVYWRDSLKGRDPFIQAEGSDPLALLDKVFLEKSLRIECLDKERYLSAYQKISPFSSWKEFKRRCGFEKKNFEIDDNVRYYIFFGIGSALKSFDFSKLPKEKLILFLFEPPTIEKKTYDPKFLDHFVKVFTWKDDLVDNKKFFKFYYPDAKPRDDELVPFAKRKLCVLINTRLSSKHENELYSERERAVQFFEDKEGEFDLFGRHWEKRNYKNYKGIAGNKIETLKQYKFSICYENTKDTQGYITEKIFDCFAAGSVPIYWGASNVTSYIPKSCFIDRRKFSNMEEVYEYISSMSEERFQEYLNAAKGFLESSTASLFTQKNFMKTIKESL